MTGGASVFRWRDAPLAEVPPAFVFAALGALSGALSAALTAALPEVGLPYPIWPALFFGSALAAAAWLCGSRDGRLALCILISTQAGWQAAVALAAGSQPHFGPLLGISGTLSHLPAGALAGAVGALLTWIGPAVVHPGLRSYSDAVRLAGAGGALGSLLWVALVLSDREGMRDMILYVPWQAGVAAAMGAMIGRAARTG